MARGGAALTRTRVLVPASSKVVLLGAAAALSLMGDMANYTVLPVHFAALGLAPMQVGLLLSVNRWVRLLTNPLARRTLDRWQPALPLAASLLLGSLLAAFYGTRPVFLAWLAARLLWGLCWSHIRHAGVTLSVSTAAEGSAGRVLGIFNGILQLGFIAGTLAGGMLYDALGFSRMFFVAAAVSAVAIPFGARGAAIDRPPQQRGEAIRGVGGVAADGALLAQAFLSTCVGTGLVMSTVGYLLKTKFGDTVALGPLVLGVATVNALLLSSRHVIDSLGSPVLGRVIDAVGTRASAAGSFVVGALALFAAAGVGAAAAAIVPLVLLFFVCAVAGGLALQVSAGLRGPRAYARYASAWDLGGAIGPLLGWAGIQYTTKPGATLLVGGALWLAGAAIAWADRGRRPPAA